MNPAGWVADVRVALRLPTRLPGFLQRPVTVAGARQCLARRFADRGRDFLRLVRRAVYGRPWTSYARLLHHAGCEYGDFERLVQTDGVEGALRAVLAAGVYLTVAELKGHRPAVRGGAAVEVTPADLRNPLVGCDLPMRSGGSRSAGTPVGWSLDFVWERAIDLCVAELARGPGERRHGVWGVPGSGAIVHLLDTSAYGMPPERWFSQVDPASRDLPARYRWSAALLRRAARLGGIALPRPELARPDRPEAVLRWLAGVLAEGATPHLLGYVSAMMALADAASRSGVDLAGVELSMGGEPLTGARLAHLQQARVRVLSRYATTEAGLLGLACLRPCAPDDVHLVHDLVAVVQGGPDRSDGQLPAGALMVSSLRPSAPLILLNASLGDVAAIQDRACGCPLGQVGWATHLWAIRSFEKLTSGGVTFHDLDVVPILEEILPARFGGAPGHYQLVEEEEDGRPRLRLFVHPDVGPVEPSAVVDAFLAAVGSVPGAARIMSQVWRDADLLSVERRAPLATVSGKVLHLHRAGPGPQGGPDGLWRAGAVGAEAVRPDRGCIVVRP